MKISIIIPVYNEEHTVRELLARVKKAPFEKELIVIDDGSNDLPGRCSRPAKRLWRHQYSAFILRRREADLA